jgi:hypothetical protein
MGEKAEMTETRWRKSSRSTSGDSCVEAAHTHDMVRDSKNPDGPALRVDLSGMVAAIKTGHLDR